MARRFPNRFQSRSRPNRAWANFVTSARVIVNAASKVLLGGFSLSNANIDETVLRVVGTIGIRSDQTGVSEDQVGAFGMIQVTDTAAAAGVASIPGPITDGADDGWFVYVPFTRSFIVLSSVGANPDFSFSIPFDSKAKRRSGDGTQLAIVVENAHATHGLTISVVLRLLAMVSGT